MNSDDNVEQINAPEYASPAADQQIPQTEPLNLGSTSESGTPSALQDLVSTMQSVDTTSPEAKLNATSMDDNNGGRIEFNEDGIPSKSIK